MSVVFFNVMRGLSIVFSTLFRPFGYYLFLPTWFGEILQLPLCLFPMQGLEIFIFQDIQGILSSYFFKYSD